MKEGDAENELPILINFSQYLLHSLTYLIIKTDNLYAIG